MEILSSVQKFFSFILVKEIKNWSNYHDLMDVFIKMCKMREHGGFSKSQSQLNHGVKTSHENSFGLLEY